MRRHVSQRSSFYKEGRVSGVIPSAVEEPRRMSRDAPRDPSTSLRCARDDELVRLRKKVDAGASRVECWRVSIKLRFRNARAEQRRQAAIADDDSGEPARRFARAKSESPGQRTLPRFR